MDINLSGEDQRSHEQDRDIAEVTEALAGGGKFCGWPPMPGNRENPGSPH
jgi:hypothetical protein